MSTETLMLVLSMGLGIVQILLAAGAATSKYGVQWNISSRDSKMPALDGMAGRLSRASENFKETFPFFAAAILLVLISGHSNSLSALGAQMYFFARLLYVPIYAFNIVYVRTMVWSVAILGIILVIVSLF